MRLSPLFPLTHDHETGEARACIIFHALVSIIVNMIPIGSLDRRCWSVQRDKGWRRSRGKQAIYQRESLRMCALPQV